MKTRLPFSTISFNTKPYLELKLDELRRSKILSDWFFIMHKPEDDESKGKEHAHVYFIPSKGVQTDDVRQELLELDPEHPDKPRGCLRMQSSKFGNWYLYGIHDPDYLASKGETRKYHYKYEDIVASNYDVLYELVYEIDVLAELGAFKGMQQAKSRGLTFQEFFNQGKVPPLQVRAFQHAWEMITVDETHRGKRLAHIVRTDDGEYFDPTTGEVIDPEEFFRGSKTTSKPRETPSKGKDAPETERTLELDPEASGYGKKPKLKTSS